MVAGRGLLFCLSLFQRVGNYGCVFMRGENNITTDCVVLLFELLVG